MASTDPSQVSFADLSTDVSWEQRTRLKRHSSVTIERKKMYVAAASLKSP